MQQEKLDPRTGRPIGDHGTAMQAIDFALDHLSVERDTFLKCWREGDLDEWPEFYEWLFRQPEAAPVAYRWRGVGEWFHAPRAPEGVNAEPLFTR